MPVLSHGTLEICLGRLVKVLIALRHFSPGSLLRHFRPGRRLIVSQAMMIMVTK